MVLNKPAGLSSEGDVPQKLRERWSDPDAFVGVIHRLDTGVSGLMVYAKTQQAAAVLSRQVLQSRNAYAEMDRQTGILAVSGEKPCFVKRYRAVLSGRADEALAEGGILRDYLFKDGRSGKVYPVKRQRKGVREAVLEYRITAQAADCSLAEITLHTGRTHQIRVQFASRKHPLWGDGKYGSREKGEIALQSMELCFEHPETKQIMSFQLPLPEGQPWEKFR